MLLSGMSLLHTSVAAEAGAVPLGVRASHGHRHSSGLNVLLLLSTSSLSLSIRNLLLLLTLLIPPSAVV